MVTQDLFCPELHVVAPLGESAARAYVVTNHYSASYPAATHRFGLWRDTRLVGAAVFGVPTSVRTLLNVFPDCEPYNESVVLSRLVLDDEVASNGESWFLSKVFRLAAEVGVRGVVSFADPVPRRVNGHLLFPGHVGAIYQATNATYTGRSAPRTLTILPTGQLLHDRAKSKIRQQEHGHEAVERRLVALGASAPRAGQNPSEWLSCALEEIGAAVIRHGGNYRYAWAIGNRSQRRHTRIALPSLSYPKTIDA